MTYNLNLIPGKVPVSVHVKQYDTGLREITFNLYYGDTTYSVPYNSTITVSGTKPDGNGFSYNVTQFSGSAVTVPMQDQMTVLAGEFPCQLTIANSGEIIGTASFLLCVEPSALSSDTPVSDTDLAMFQQLANQTQTEAAGVANATAQIAANTQNIATNTAAISSLNSKFTSYLPADTNIDNWDTTGFWLYQRTSPRSHTGTFPYSDSYGTLIHVHGTSTNVAMQMIRSNSIGNSYSTLYVRFKDNTWGSWFKFEDNTLKSGNISVASGWTVQDGNNWCRKSGHVAEFYLEVTGGTLASGWNNLGTLPSGFTPMFSVNIVGVDNGTSGVPACQVQVSSAGEIRVYKTSALTNKLRIFGVYLVA